DERMTEEQSMETSVGTSGSHLFLLWGLRGHISSFYNWRQAFLKSARSALSVLNRFPYRLIAVAVALYPSSPTAMANSFNVSPHSRRPRYNTRSRPLSP